MTECTDPMDVVRAFFRDVNRGDVDATVTHYHPECVLEHVFTGDDGVHLGLDEARARWEAECATYAGALPGHHRVQVTRVAGMETGWGWVRADWVSSLDDRGSDAVRHLAGYSHFWIEDSLIRRQRNISRPIASIQAAPPAESERRYPSRPLVGVGAVILSDDDRVVLVKRRQEPLAGQWSLPGGMLELGETLEAGAAREILEETGLIVDVGAVVDVFDRILVDEEGRVRYHFVLIDYLCRPRGGTLVAASDVGEVALVNPARVGDFRVTDKAGDVIRRAVAIRAAQLKAGTVW
jgi:ADP-ribose pyrophosphatase YjhB (NUDIX family)